MIDWVEVLWTAIALVGLTTCLWEARVAWANVRFLETNNFNGKRKIVAWGHLRRELLQAVIQAMFVGIGLLAIAAPPSPTPRRNFTVGLLILASAIINTNTLLDGRDRRRLIDYWRNVDLSHVREREAAVKNTAESLARIEEGNKVVAKNLVIAQKAVDGVAADLAESHVRADETEGVAGEAADAASRSPNDE